jgi:hypothetical protein
MSMRQFVLLALVILFALSLTGVAAQALPPVGSAGNFNTPDTALEAKMSSSDSVELLLGCYSVIRSHCRIALRA